ncbi:MAG: ABC transporter ATP-binding protein/permease [Ruminobacter sp.]|uniref:ABC transporter ATP-binding protein/permease n=1 Tax=Ruminobacter sp. TaxID=2774296 RepID=UPI00257D29B5|nr:ABC transporter ATP-binding protein/permease [Ruminobacter sp.]MBQ3774806.1 ABC transporter ATP-binding protein/permease [Ruminobacter sp.]
MKPAKGERKIPVFSIFGARNHDGNNPDKHESLKLRETVGAFFKIAMPYWRSKESFAGRLQFIGILLFTSGTIFLAKQFNDWYKEFWDNVQNYNMDGFYGGLYLFLFLATLHVCNDVYKSYVISALSIRWRRWLTTHYTERYLNESTYYRLQLTDQKTDNPDQRIAEDLNSFVTLTIGIVVRMITSTAMLVTFSIILWGLSSRVENVTVGDFTFSLPDGYLFYLALIYAVCGTVITFIIGKPLALLHFRQQRFEADYRYSLIRLRENAEAVALYKGEKEESSRLNSYFGDVVKNYIYLINRTKSLEFFTFGCDQLAVIFPILVASPLYFAKIITIGSLMQINSAFSRVYSSLSVIMSLFPELATWKAVIDRLALFEKSMKKSLQLSKPDVRYEAESVRIDNLSITKPNGTALISNLNLQLKNGDRLLIKGPSGVGKSTLLRAVAGIWPYSSGSVTLPESKKVLFLSQKPYMPMGTLAQTICYPSAEFSDEKYLASLLEKVGLEHLVPHLNTEDQWGLVLSLGEQQRIAFLRAIINRPDVIFMDEVTSAMDEPNESKLYAMLKDELKDSIMISVGHRSTLENMHNRILDFTDKNPSLK